MRPLEGVPCCALWWAHNSTLIHQQVCFQGKVIRNLRTAKAKIPRAPKAMAPLSAPVTPKSRRLNIVARNEAEADRETVKGVLSSLPSAVVAVDFARPTSGDVSLMETLAVLREKAEAINAGNLKDAEALLMSQALALNTIFGELARRAALNMGEYLDATDKYMRLALKAQGQCRATLETLAAIKNPPVLFARQANIANGPQQVNNGALSPAHAKSATIAPKELLEAHPVSRLDDGAKGPAGESDPALAAVAAIDGTADR